MQEKKKTNMRNYIDSFLAYMKIERIASTLTIYDYNKE
ncbi:unnamed protein product, partial [marine sediment metagenome]